MTRMRCTMSARPTEKDVHRWLSQRLDGFYCDLQVMYMPHAMARTDEAVEVDARGLNARDTAKALMKATGHPHTNRCGWPFCLVELDWNGNEGGAV